MAELKQLHQGQSELPAVVFLHGLGGDWIDTWLHPQASPKSMWLHWVGEDSQGAGRSVPHWYGEHHPPGIIRRAPRIPADRRRQNVQWQTEPAMGSPATE